ncbi:membrane protein [Nocardioides marinisabuli]|uniref:Membrane protein n=1 Tax=Nocardioides marinisabuli TaxID=419476 RepID=A0A7Y9EYI8_9ACTN|nr:membrane protein [Nocardioides marinisabuli]
MASVKERLAEVRERRPLVDHLVRMQEHYGDAKAGQHAGAITYFAFLSFFPILALSFFVIGVISNVWPDANATLVDAIKSLFPGMIGPGEGQMQLADFRTFSGLAGVVGFLGVLYSGLGWISALRLALFAVFEPPEQAIPNFVMGKLRDLVTLAVIGLTLLVAVAVTGLVASFSEEILGWIGLDEELGWLVVLLTVALGLAANALLFFTMFRLLGEPQAPRTSLVRASLLGAVLFEVLKQLSKQLIASTQGQPAFQAFGIALVLVVWINYFSRVVLYAAAFAHTSPEARALRPADEPAPVQGPALPSGPDAMAVLVASAAPAEPERGSRPGLLQRLRARGRG